MKGLGALGLIAALGLPRLLTEILYGMSPIDPATFMAIALLLTVVVLLDCYLPVRHHRAHYIRRIAPDSALSEPGRGDCLQSLWFVGVVVGRRGHLWDHFILGAGHSKGCGMHSSGASRIRPRDDDFIARHLHQRDADGCLRDDDRGRFGPVRPHNARANSGATRRPLDPAYEGVSRRKGNCVHTADRVSVADEDRRAEGRAAVGRKRGIDSGLILRRRKPSHSDVLTGGRNRGAVHRAPLNFPAVFRKWLRFGPLAVLQPDDRNVAHFLLGTVSIDD